VFEAYVLDSICDRISLFTKPLSFGCGSVRSCGAPK
jgi:hypothetical protein